MGKCCEVVDVHGFVADYYSGALVGVWGACGLMMYWLLSGTLIWVTVV